jgi:hypothetical protein
MGGPGEKAHFGTLLSKKLWQTVFADCLRDHKVCLAVRKANWILLRRKLENPVTTLFLLDFVWLDHQDLLLNLVRRKLENPWTTLFLLDVVQLDHWDLSMIYISFADEERGCCCHCLAITVSYNWWCFFLPLSDDDDDDSRTGTSAFRIQEGTHKLDKLMLGLYSKFWWVHHNVEAAYKENSRTDWVKCMKKRVLTLEIVRMGALICLRSSLL